MATSHYYFSLSSSNLVKSKFLFLYYKLLFLQENYSNKIIKPSGSIFGIDLDIYELVEDENAIPESNGLKVIFSNAMLTHCKKLLSKDKEAMAELNKIRGMKPSQIKALQKNKPATTVKEEINDGK